MRDRLMLPDQKSQKSLLAFVAIILAFVLIMVFIWLWYDIQISSLETRSNKADTAHYQINL